MTGNIVGKWDFLGFDKPYLLMIRYGLCLKHMYKNAYCGNFFGYLKEVPYISGFAISWQKNQHYRNVCRGHSECRKCRSCGLIYSICQMPGQGGDGTYPSPIYLTFAFYLMYTSTYTREISSERGIKHCSHLLRVFTQWTCQSWQFDVIDCKWRVDVRGMMDWNLICKPRSRFISWQGRKND